jgi:predicted dehydrogenase
MPVASRVRLGVAGLVHDHVWDVLPRFAAHGGYEFVSACDPNDPLTERARRAFGFAHVARDAEALWSERPEVVLYYGPNAGSAPLVEAAAAHGAHVLVEKPLAANLAQARRIDAAARRAGIFVMCNWPTAWDARVQHAAALAQAGDLGQLYQVRYRAAHAGPREIGCSPYFWSWLYDAEQNGAGALMDYCCYGAAMAAWLLGMPETVVALKGRLVKADIPVEDNAVVLMQFARALGTAEGCWTQAGHLYELYVFGDRAGLVMRGAELLRIDADHPEGVALEVPPQPEGARDPAEYLLRCLREQRTPQGLVSLEVAVRAQTILEAGLVSARTGTAVMPALL